LDLQTYRIGVRLALSACGLLLAACSPAAPMAPPATGTASATPLPEVTRVPQGSGDVVAQREAEEVAVLVQLAGAVSQGAKEIVSFPLLRSININYGTGVATFGFTDGRATAQFDIAVSSTSTTASDWSVRQHDTIHPVFAVDHSVLDLAGLRVPPSKTFSAALEDWRHCRNSDDTTRLTATLLPAPEGLIWTVSCGTSEGIWFGTMYNATEVWRAEASPLQPPETSVPR